MEWPIKNLADVCDLQNGYAFKSKDYIEASNTLNIRMSNIRPDGSFNPDHNIRFLPDTYVEKHSMFLLSDGDLVIAMTDMAGDPKILGLPTLVKNLNGRKFLLNQRVGKLCDFSDEIYIPYLRYYLSSPIMKEYYKTKGTGGLQINISKKDVLSAEIPLPPILEQKRIVAILDQAFANIEQARTKTEQNLKNARELFESYLQQVFSQRSEGWVEATLENTAEVSTGGTPLKSNNEFWGGNIPWYSSGELNDTFTIESKSCITAAGLDGSNAKLFPKGSLLVGMYDTAALKMSILDREGSFNQAIAGVKPNNKINMEFILHSINSIKPELLKLRRGVRQ